MAKQLSVAWPYVFFPYIQTTIGILTLTDIGYCSKTNQQLPSEQLTMPLWQKDSMFLT
jgi:hypothetical protein